MKVYFSFYENFFPNVPFLNACFKFLSVCTTPMKTLVIQQYGIRVKSLPLARARARARTHTHTHTHTLLTKVFDIPALFREA